MLAEVNTVAVAVVKRDATEDLCVGDEVVGTVTINENFTSWALNEHGSKLGLDLPPMTVLSVGGELLHKTLIATVERQLARLRAGSALTDADRNLLYPELQDYLGDTGFAVLRHPYVYMVPYSHSAHEAVMANARFDLVTRKLAEAKAEGEWTRYIYRHERPYRLQAFEDVSAHLRDEEYWQTLSDVWTDSENIHQNLAAWKKYWSSKRPGRAAAMTEDERAALAALPDTLSIYRGTTPASNIRSMSWTITRRMAEWFGNRYSSHNDYYYLATAEIAKADVLAYLLGHNETEIVVLPSKLRDLRKERIKIAKRR